MNTTNLNSTSEDLSIKDSVESSKPRLSSESSFQMPKKVKKSKEAFRTISEVANKLKVQQHVLRFWETKFSQVRPLKRGGGRRYYRPEDVALLERIHHLLYTEGYTIKGVQKLMKEQGKAKMIATQLEVGNSVVTSQAEPVAIQTKKQPISDKQRAVLEIMLAELKAMRAMIKV